MPRLISRFCWLMPQDDDLDLVAGLDHLAGVVDARGPAHLRDVDQALDARLQLHEGAVAHHVDDLAGDARADGVLLGDLLPGVGRQLLQAQGDLAALLVDVEDHHLDPVVDAQPLARVLQALPAHVGDVQQAVDAAEVDEGAEVGEVLDRPGADLADGDLGQEPLAEGDALGLDEAAARDDDVAPVLVDRQDDAADLAVEVVGDVGGRRMSTWLAGRKALMPMSTSSPPLILRVTLPVTTSPTRCTEMTRSQARMRWAFLRERTTSPVSSSMPSSRTSISSPGCGGGSPGSHSLRGTRPSDL
jgi:hypothetical protein